jgi:hypothetical protein
LVSTNEGGHHDGSKKVFRRRHSAELNALLLEECAQSGASVVAVAMTRGRLECGELRAQLLLRDRALDDRLRQRVAFLRGEGCGYGDGQAGHECEILHRDFLVGFGCS